MVLVSVADVDDVDSRTQDCLSCERPIPRVGKPRRCERWVHPRIHQNVEIVMSVEEACVTKVLNDRMFDDNGSLLDLVGLVHVVDKCECSHDQQQEQGAGERIYGVQPHGEWGVFDREKTHNLKMFVILFDLF